MERLSWFWADLVGSDPLNTIVTVTRLSEHVRTHVHITHLVEKEEQHKTHPLNSFIYIK